MSMIRFAWDQKAGMTILPSSKSNQLIDMRNEPQNCRFRNSKLKGVKPKVFLGLYDKVDPMSRWLGCRICI